MPPQTICGIMNFENLLQKYKPLLQRFWLPIVLASLGLIFFIYGLIYLLSVNNRSNEIVFEAGENEFSQESQPKGEIVVDIEGAITKPGVYKLKENSRLQDVMVLAGGLSENADREWVAKNLNLAVKVKDGMKIYVPGEGENVGAGSSRPNVGTNHDSSDISNTQININEASVGELDSLPGVGLVTAQKIIDNRPYNSLEELLDRKVVGNSVFEKIKDRAAAY